MVTYVCPYFPLYAPTGTYTKSSTRVLLATT